MLRIPTAIALLALVSGLPVAAQTGARPAAQPGTTTRLGGGEQRWVGEPISISVKNADLQDVIRLISKTAGLNLVVDDDLKGKTVTLDLTEVPWDQALDLVLRTHGLGAEWNGNLIQISSTGRLVTQHQRAEQLRKARESSGGLVSVARTLSYANAADAEQLVRKELSERGRVTLDRRTNTLIITDTPAVVRRLTGLLDAGDGRPAPQVVTSSNGVGVSASSVAGRPAGAPRAADGPALASWNGWLLECEESFTARLEAEGRELRQVAGSGALLARTELDAAGLELAKLQLGRLMEVGRLEVKQAHPVALGPGGQESIELGPLGGGATAMLDLGLERNGGRFVLTFRARRSSGGRLPLAWHGPLSSGWVVELQPSPGEPWSVLLLAPESTPGG